MTQKVRDFITKQIKCVTTYNKLSIQLLSFPEARMTVSTQQEIMEVGQLVFVFVQMLFSCTVTKSYNILSLLPSFS